MHEPWGRELADESIELGGMVMGAIFLIVYFKKNFTSHWHGSVGMASNYLFRSLFSDYIFVWGAVTVGMRVWGQEYGTICF